MLQWINKILGGDTPDLPPDVPAQWAQLFQEYLRPLGNLPAGKGDNLARDIFLYVVFDQAPGVLHEVSQQQAVGELLGITGYGYQRGKLPKQSIYANLEQVPLALMLRWARVLEACVGTQNASLFLMQIPGGQHWPEALLLHAADLGVTIWTSEQPKAKHFSANYLERLLTAAGMDPAALLISAFATPVESRYGAQQRLLMISKLEDYEQALERHLQQVRPLLQPAAVAQRLHVLAMLEKISGPVLGRLAPELSELGVSSSKQVRAAAEPLLRRGGKAAVEPLSAIANKGKPEQRLHALRLLKALADDAKDTALRDFARDTAAADKAPSVQALIAEWEADSAAEVEAPTQHSYEVPEIEWAVEVTSVLTQQLNAIWSELNAAVERSNKQMREHHKRMAAQGHKFQLHLHEPYPESDLKALRDYLAFPQPKCPQKVSEKRNHWQFAADLTEQVAKLEGMTPVLLFKVLKFFGLVANNRDSLTHFAAMAFNTLHRASGRPTLIELGQMLEKAGYPPQTLMFSYCYGWGTPIAKDWDAAAVWPYFAHRLELLVQTLTLGNKDYYFERSALFRAIATFPTPPAVVVNTLFDLALGSGKTDRPLAQQALANHSGKEARIINALSDGKGETRAVAAQWLARLRHEAAIPALEAAVAKEKQDVAKGAILDALQVFGRPVEKYLDRDKLAAEAEKLLAKGLPKSLEWFVWSALPQVRWHDTKEPVPLAVLQWLLVQAVKQKSPEPNAVLRKYCSMFDPRDREELGQFVLENWLREDVRPVPPEQATKTAEDTARSTHQQMQQYPQYYKDTPWFGLSVEQLIAQFLPGCLRQPAGSAIDSKGLLAVAAACAAERAAPPVARYLKEWYGSRAAQGKALIAMLAWIEHPSATQLMLSIGNRFRTKSFQEEATRHAEALAERKGWTLAELADRTMPSAGFDETGTQTFSYGQREFTAKLLPDFKIELFNPDGKKISALPEPRQDDDAELAKEAKKALSAAKKEIKSVIDLQTDRLYEALCTERDWPFEDWNGYLNQHPIVRRLVQRLVWVAMAEGRVVQLFRPLDDGTLTDCDDNAVQLDGSARVRLAHDSLLSAEAIAQWQQHLADYEIAPLFQQLGKGVYTLPEARAKDDCIKDFEGHLLEAFALRGRALKLGYTRGPAEDGGWFHVYQKRFPTLNLEAVIEFTGNPLPEENRTVGLLALSFSRAGGDSWERPRLPLADVPKVLLSECYNDLRLIAAEGSGFDPDWAKKTEY